LESLLRQLEYQAGLAAARGERPIDTEWLRSELGLTAPLSERLDRVVVTTTRRAHAGSLSQHSYYTA
jgi:hypothetical protein